MTMQAGWHFWIDRGGTCSDVVALASGGVFLTRKLLSSHPTYADAAIRGIRDVLGLRDGEPIPGNDIASVKMGTTVVTNALLERRGEAVVLMVREGLRDVLGIRNDLRGQRRRPGFRRHVRGADAHDEQPHHRP